MRWIPLVGFIYWLIKEWQALHRHEVELAWQCEKELTASFLVVVVTWAAIMILTIIAGLV